MPIEQTRPTRKLTDVERSDLTHRALAAWFSSPDAAIYGTSNAHATARMATKATPGDDGTTHYLHFAVVHAGADVLAVYRVRQMAAGFMLRRMARPPKDLVRLKG